MEIQETIDIRYEEIEGLKQNLSENHYMNPEQEDELEELIAKAIKFGELCAQRDAKSQVVPEGFLVVSSKELLDLTVAINAVDLATHTDNKTNEVREMWQDIAFRLIALGAQEQSHD